MCVCVYIYFVKLQEITRQKPKNLKTRPDGNFWLAEEDVQEKGEFGSTVTWEVLLTSYYFCEVKLKRSECSMPRMRYTCYP